MDRHIDGWIHIVSKPDILILVGVTAPVVRVVFGERWLPNACSSQYHSSSCACGLRWEAASWCVFFSVSQLRLCVWSWVKGGFLMCVILSITAPVVRVILGERRLPNVCSSQYHSSSCACDLGWEAAS